MVQNAGWLASTAIVLALVTAPLPAGLRAQFFASTASRASPSAAAGLLRGYRHAMVLLAAVAFAGTLAAAASRRSSR